MHVLVTGVSSFVGGHVADHLVRSGLSVTGTYRNSNNTVERLRVLCETHDLRLVELDVSDGAAYSGLPKTIDGVVHIAGVTSTAGIPVEDMLACNVSGTLNVLRYAHAAGAERLIFASSLELHGKIGVPIIDEHTPVVAPNAYGASKCLGERLLATLCEMPCVAIRLPGVLGPGAHRAWLPTLLARIKAGGDVTIFNPDSLFNNAAHVDDLARFVAGLLERRWEGFAAFPVGAGGTITVRQVVDRLMAATGQEVAVDIRPSSQTSFLISSDRAIRDFGYAPMHIGAMLDRYATE